jgi:hypothetical protein
LPGGDTGGGLIGPARPLLFASVNSRGDFVDATSYQLLTGSDLVEAQPHRLEVTQHRVKPPVIGLAGG